MQERFLKLAEDDDSERRLFRQLSKAIEKIESDFNVGIKVKKELIPLEYKDVNTLWKYDLRSGWRLLYTINKNEIVIYSIIIEWLSHTEYERRFKY